MFLSKKLIVKAINNLDKKNRYKHIISLPVLKKTNNYSTLYLLSSLISYPFYYT